MYLRFATLEVTYKTLIFVLSISVCFVTYADDGKWKLNPTKDENAPFGVYIPSNINDAHKELDKILSTQLKQEMKKGSESDLSQYHFGLGRWLRNN